MKIYINAVCLFLILTFGCKNTPTFLNVEKQEQESVNQISVTNPIQLDFEHKTKTLISAHRGGRYLKGYPENCLETIQHLQSKGIEIFEVDVNKTKDDVIILMHDNSLERTTTGNGKVENFTFEQLKKFNLVDDFGNPTDYEIPSFKELLNWAKNTNAFLSVDFKQNVSYQRVIEMIRKADMQNQSILIAYSVGQAKKLNQLASEMMISAAMRNQKELDRILETDIPTNKLIAFTGTRLSTKELYENIHNQNMLTILGTLGNLDNRARARGLKPYREYEKLGVDIFATDYPLEVQKALTQFNE